MFIQINRSKWCGWCKITRKSWKKPHKTTKPKSYSIQSLRSSPSFCSSSCFFFSTLNSCNIHHVPFATFLLYRLLILSLYNFMWFNLFYLCPYTSRCLWMRLKGVCWWCRLLCIPILTFLFFAVFSLFFGVFSTSRHKKFSRFICNMPFVFENVTTLVFLQQRSEVRRLCGNQ